MNLSLSAFDDFRGQRRILTISCEAFSVMNSPPEEINQSFTLGRIFLIFIGEDVGVAGNRISIGAGRVCNRNGQVTRRRGGRSGGSRSDCVNGGLNKGTARVLDYRRRQLVLNGIRQLDITDSVRLLFDLTRYAFVAFATLADRPLRRFVSANCRLPLFADFCKVIGEDERGAA